MPELKGDPTGSPFCVCEGAKWVAMPIAREIVSAGNQALAILRGLGRQNGKIFALCMIWRPRTGKGVLSGKIFTICIPKQRFAGLFGYAARKSCQNQLILDTYRRYIATEGGVFPSEAPFGIHQAKILPRMSAWECFRRIFCHRRHTENASLRYPATADTRRTHHGEILPSPTSGERIMVKSCPRRTLRSMPW